MYSRFFLFFIFIAGRLPASDYTCLNVYIIMVILCISVLLLNLLQLSAYRKDFCEWFRNINTPEDLILFQCPKNSFMAGVESAYDSASFDRV